ncbi:hypothetical protein KKG83_00035 [Candidatus Micrarchaeota archaeon]|nr:hypothetical protein [Candidatus Micrarchaeota archaeon]MBU2475840.1 hypothetical protein [Candidatus Micrarchaeota archaeon]
MNPNKTSLVLALVFSLLLFYGCVGSPELKIDNTEKEDKIWITEGCYSEISGNIRNKSSIDAEEVVVSCSAIQQNSVFDSKSKNIGLIKADSSVVFSVDVDTDCLKGEVEFECSVSCNNCNGNSVQGFDSTLMIVFGIVLVLAVLAIIIVSIKKTEKSKRKTKK